MAITEFDLSRIRLSALTSSMRSPSTHTAAKILITRTEPVLDLELWKSKNSVYYRSNIYASDQ